MISGSLTQIPCAEEQGNYLVEQEIIFEEQGFLQLHINVRFRG